MNPKDKVVCTAEEWFNAFGEQSFECKLGDRLTIVDTKYVGGLRFLAFKEVPKGSDGHLWFMSDGFQLVRRLN